MNDEEPGCEAQNHDLDQTVEYIRWKGQVQDKRDRQESLQAEVLDRLNTTLTLMIESLRTLGLDQHDAMLAGRDIQTALNQIAQNTTATIHKTSDTPENASEEHS